MSWRFDRPDFLDLESHCGCRASGRDGRNFPPTEVTPLIVVLRRGRRCVCGGGGRGGAWRLVHRGLAVVARAGLRGGGGATLGSSDRGGPGRSVRRGSAVAALKGLGGFVGGRGGSRRWRREWSLAVGQARVGCGCEGGAWLWRRVEACPWRPEPGSALAPGRRLALALAAERGGGGGWRLDRGGANRARPWRRVLASHWRWPRGAGSAVCATRVGAWPALAGGGPEEDCEGIVYRGRPRRRGRRLAAPAATGVAARVGEGPVVGRGGHAGDEKGGAQQRRRGRRGRNSMAAKGTEGAELGGGGGHGRRNAQRRRRVGRGRLSAWRRGRAL